MRLPCQSHKAIWGTLPPVRSALPMAISIEVITESFDFFPATLAIPVPAPMMSATARSADPTVAAILRKCIWPRSGYFGFGGSL